jgi:quinoprotein glucose dehydrogenase
VRAEAIRALQALRNPQLNDVLQQGLKDGSPLVRSAALQALAAEKPADALPLLAKTLDEGTAYEQQQALDTLALLKSEEADKLLAQWFDRLLQGSVPAELHLDLLTAAGKRDALKAQLQKYESARAGNDPLAAWRETLRGGDADRGKRIFLERAQVSCVRCHKVRGEGGDVGPDLSKLGREKPREYVLESIVAPNAQIAKGFETAVVVTDEGKVHVGIVKKEDQNSLQLMTSEGKLIDVPKASIEERTAGKSSMPEDLLKHLSKADLRDLVEFLASQTQP